MAYIQNETTYTNSNASNLMKMLPATYLAFNENSQSKRNAVEYFYSISSLCLPPKAALCRRSKSDFRLWLNKLVCWLIEELPNLSPPAE